MKDWESLILDMALINSSSSCLSIAPTAEAHLSLKFSF
jgi:hypothetical protein